MKMQADEMEKLRAADPVRPEDVHELCDEKQAQALFSQIVQTPAAPHRSLRGNQRKQRKLVLTVGAGAVALATVIVAAFVFQTGRAGFNSPVAGPVTLEDMARVALKQDSPAATTEGYRYTKSESAAIESVAGDGGYALLVPVVRELWVARDGSGRLRTERGKPTFLSDRDRQAWEAAGKPDLRAGTVSDDSFGPGGLYSEDLSTLPTEPDALFRLIEERSKNSGPGLHPEMFVMVGDLLRETVAPAELRAALFRVAERIPGVKVTAEIKDPKDRPGVGVSLDYDDNNGRVIRSELIFDRDSSQLLAERQVAGERLALPPNYSSPPPGAPTSAPAASPAPGLDVAPGTVIEYAVYLQSGTVEKVDERPA